MNNQNNIRFLQIWFYLQSPIYLGNKAEPYNQIIEIQTTETPGDALRRTIHLIKTNLRERWPGRRFRLKRYLLINRQVSSTTEDPACLPADTSA